MGLLPLHLNVEKNKIFPLENFRFFVRNSGYPRVYFLNLNFLLSILLREVQIRTTFPVPTNSDEHSVASSVSGHLRVPILHSMHYLAPGFKLKEVDPYGTGIEYGETVLLFIFES